MKKKQKNQNSKAYIITGIIIAVILGLLLLIKCSSNNTINDEKMINVIDRTDKAISQYINDEISYSELAEKLKSIDEYCKAFKEESKKLHNESDTNVDLLCVSTWNNYYSASSDSINDKYGLPKKYDLVYWEDRRRSMVEDKKYFIDIKKE